MQSDELLTARVSTKFFSRFMLPEGLAQYPDWTYDVDLDVPVFRWLYKRKVDVSGAVQVVGSYVPEDGSWLWGWANTSVPETGHRRLSDVVRDWPVLQNLTKERTFRIDEKWEADEFANWISARTGWLGAYQHPTEHGGCAYLAPKLEGPDLWCIECARWPEQSPLQEFAPGYAICAECIEVMRDIVEEKLSSTPTPGFESHVDLCFICGQREQGVFGRNGYMGLHCMQALLKKPKPTWWRRLFPFGRMR